MVIVSVSRVTTLWWGLNMKIHIKCLTRSLLHLVDKGQLLWWFILSHLVAHGNSPSQRWNPCLLHFVWSRHHWAAREVLLWWFYRALRARRRTVWKGQARRQGKFTGVDVGKTANWGTVATITDNTTNNYNDLLEENSCECYLSSLQVSAQYYPLPVTMWDDNMPTWGGEATWMPACTVTQLLGCYGPSGEKSWEGPPASAAQGSLNQVSVRCWMSDANGWGAQAGRSGMIQDFIMLLRRARSLKMYALFISGMFHFVFSDLFDLE